MTFSFDQLSTPLIKAIKDLGFTEPSEIQQDTIPFLLSDSNRDFVGQAQTGTGKTAAFCLPLLEKMDLNIEGVQALIISPTRELAGQINQEIIKFSKYLKVNTAIVYGGVAYKPQIDSIRRAHIVIATPGRAIDLINKGKLNLATCKKLIIDEADEMLKMGFIDDVELLMDKISDDANTWMFSATMPRPIIELTKKKLNNPEIVKVQKKTLSNESVTQMYSFVQKRDFAKALKAVLLTEKDFYGIVFCETKDETRQLCEKLQSTNIKAIALHGDLNQSQRDHAMRLFKERRADVLVCTDVASRGLDISDVTHVINMGLPRKHDSYVHRIGRTGRAGQKGIAINFVPPQEKRNLHMIERLTNQEMTLFKLSDVSEIKSGKVAEELAKMDGIKSAVKEKGADFKMDDSFSLYKEYFNELDKEELMKVLFSFHLKKELVDIDESINSFKTSVVATTGRIGSPRGGAGRSRSSSGRSYSGRPSSSGRSYSSGGRSESRSSDSRSDAKTFEPRSSDGGGRSSQGRNRNRKRTY